MLTDDILKVITKEVMEEYEQVRQSGVCNMFNYNCVVRCASSMELYAIGSLTMDDYKMLLLNFGELMAHYGVEQ